MLAAAMSDIDLKPAPTDSIALSYASEVLDPSADRLLRRIVAWMAIVEGGAAVVSNVIHVGLAMGWLPSPANMSWEISWGWSTAMMAAIALTSVATLVGGLLLLRRVRASIVLLRAAGIAAIALSVANTVIIMLTFPGYAGLWSTFGSAAYQTLAALRGFAPPTLLVLLTLPPLARRMVG